MMRLALLVVCLIVGAQSCCFPQVFKTEIKTDISELADKEHGTGSMTLLFDSHNGEIVAKTDGSVLYVDAVKKLVNLYIPGPKGSCTTTSLAGHFNEVGNAMSCMLNDPKLAAFRHSVGGLDVYRATTPSGVVSGEIKVDPATCTLKSWEMKASKDGETDDFKMTFENTVLSVNPAEMKPGCPLGKPEGVANFDDLMSLLTAVAKEIVKA